MLDNGYSLTRIELYNWGNFQGLHKVPFREGQDWGPLFQTAPAVAVLGLNGSGKSTLIDGLMMLLLPFENQLRLGVTNDYEKGDSGGRSVKDYVLGKFASVGGGVDVDPEQIYGRKDGCSLFVSVFRHNYYPDRSVTLVRTWWYSNYKVSDNQACILAYEPLSIETICRDGKTPKNLKALKENLGISNPSAQVFDTISNYFQALSSVFGHLQKDDLKILNRAFYVKSISQIDQFIRGNMLLEQESPHLERLLENVRNAKDIATSIQSCLKKMSVIEKILKDLKKLSASYEEKNKVEIEIRISEVYRDWQELDLLKSDILDNEEKLKALSLETPQIKFNLENKQSELHSLESRIKNSDLKNQVLFLEKEAENLEQRVLELQKKQNIFTKKISPMGLSLPKSHQHYDPFLKSLNASLKQAESDQLENETLLEKINTEKILLNETVGSVRAELDHVSKFKTLIPADLYEIKNQACQDLKIPKKHLLFVGEIIQILPEMSDHRRAIESVLFPISRNLLCHPDNLTDFTKWLNTQGLKKDLTVKRIEPEELTSPLPIDAQRVSGKNKILGMIEVKSAKENPFYNYLWTWLMDTFNYQLCDLKVFRNSEGKLVTDEGLVKTDSRTMRKLKKNFNYSLGWDNQEIIDQLAQKLIELQKKFTEISAQIEVRVQNRDQLIKQILQLKDLDLAEVKEILEIPTFKERVQEIQKMKSEIFQKNPDLQKLEASILVAKKQLDELQRKFYSSEAQFKSSQDKIKLLTDKIPQLEQKMKFSFSYTILTKKFETAFHIEEKLKELDKKLKSKKLIFTAYNSQLESEKLALDQDCQLGLAQLNQNLQQARLEIADTSLLFNWKSFDHIHEFIEIWKAAYDRLNSTDLPLAQDKWKQFFNQVLLDSIRDMINEFKTKVHDIRSNIDSINEVLKMTNYEELPTELRYLRIDYQLSSDERIRAFKKYVSEIEKVLGPLVRSQIENQSDEVMQVLEKFVEHLQKDPNEREFVTDVRNHFAFQVASHRRVEGGSDPIVEIFTGSKKDAKSSAQTTQLAYTLLASCLAYRFHFHDPIRGKDTLRILILDEFGGKFDNEKPKEIIKLLDQMGFQSILVSPMAKADLLAGSVSQMVFVYKISASQSKLDSVSISRKEDYYNLIKAKTQPLEKSVHGH